MSDLSQQQDEHVILWMITALEQCFAGYATPEIWFLVRAKYHCDTAMLAEKETGE